MAVLQPGWNKMDRGVDRSGGQILTKSYCKIDRPSGTSSASNHMKGSVDGDLRRRLITIVHPAFLAKELSWIHHPFLLHIYWTYQHWGSGNFNEVILICWLFKCQLSRVIDLLELSCEISCEIAQLSLCFHCLTIVIWPHQLHLVLSLHILLDSSGVPGLQVRVEILQGSEIIDCVN